VPKQERSRDRIDEILKVSMQLIGQKGIDAVTMKEIAALSGGPIASVYQYFPNKSAIIAMLHERYVDDVRSLISEHVGKISTSEEALLATEVLFDLYYHRMRERPSTQDLLNAIQADKTLADVDIAETRSDEAVRSERPARQLPAHAVRHVPYGGGNPAACPDGSRRRGRQDRGAVQVDRQDPVHLLFHRQLSRVCLKP
jgi:AcrR family transcriptional regulator